MEKYFGLAKELLDKGLARETASYGDNNTYDQAIKFTSDLDFYIKLAKEQGGKVLDVGCGTGRVLESLLKNGIDASGMDNSTHMLKLAAKKLKQAGFNPELHEGDMRNFNLSQKYSLIIIPYYTMIYMHTDRERTRVMQCCYEHLVSKGLLAFDFDAGVAEPGLSKPWLGFQQIDNTGQVVVQTVQMNQVSQHQRVINMITYRLKDKESYIEVNAGIESSISASRMEQLLEDTGFIIKGFYKDYDLSPYSGGEECLVIAEKL